MGSGARCCTEMRICVLVFSLMMSAGCADQLVLVVGVWRHGDRAPARLFYPETARDDPMFRRGLGNLTKKGFESAAKFGDFLQAAYGALVQTQEEVSVRSTAHFRTYETASTAMKRFLGDTFNESEIYYQMKDDWFLKPNFMKCPTLQALQQAKCPKTVAFPKDYQKNFDSYEYDLYKCAALDRNTTHFKTDFESFRRMEAVLNEGLNGYDFSGSDITPAHVKEADKIYRQVQRITLGVRPYHEYYLLRTYATDFFNNLTQIMLNHADCVTKEDFSLCPKKFFGFSAQDLLLFPVLELLNASTAAVGENGAPGYTSAIFFELKTKKDKHEHLFSVTVKYRKGSNDEVVDLTKFFPLCNESCAYDDFKHALSRYKFAASNKDACENSADIADRLSDIARKGVVNGIVSESATPAKSSMPSSTSVPLLLLIALYNVWFA